MNRYCRKLIIPEDIMPTYDMSGMETEGYSWYQFHKELQESDFPKGFIEWMRSMNIYSEWMEIFYTPPNDVGYIHSDNTCHSDWTKIIFQVGAKGSTMKWYEAESKYKQRISTAITEYVDDAKDRVEDQYHGDVLVAEEKNCKLLHEAEIGDCSLANVGYLHNSYNPTNERRFVFTYAPNDVTTRKRLLWDDAINRLSDYLV